MATLLTTIITTATGTGAAAGTAAAAGAAGAGAAAAGASAGAGLLSGLSTAATVVGGLAAFASGQQQAAALESQAVQEETLAVQEELQGRQAALDALRNLNRQQAQIATAGFASGIGGGEGSVAAAQREAERAATEDIELSRTGAQLRSAARRGQAQQSRASASGARLGGLFQAVQGGISLLQRREARG